MLGYGPKLFESEGWVRHCLDDGTPALLRDIIQWSPKFRQEALEKMVANPPESDFGLEELLVIPEVRDEVWRLIKGCEKHFPHTLREAFYRLNPPEKREAWQLLVAEYGKMDQNNHAVADDWFLEAMSKDDSAEYREEARALIARLNNLPKPLWRMLQDFKCGDMEDV